MSNMPRLSLHANTHVPSHGQSSDPKWSVALPAQPVVQSQALQDEGQPHYEQVRDVQQVGPAARASGGEGRGEWVG